MDQDSINNKTYGGWDEALLNMPVRFLGLKFLPFTFSLTLVHILLSRFRIE